MFTEHNVALFMNRQGAIFPFLLFLSLSLLLLSFREDYLQPVEIYETSKRTRVTQPFTLKY
jgi:hypothetical protein